MMKNIPKSALYIVIGVLTVAVIVLAIVGINGSVSETPTESQSSEVSDFSADPTGQLSSDSTSTDSVEDVARDVKKAAKNFLDVYYKALCNPANDMEAFQEVMTDSGIQELYYSGDQPTDPDGDDSSSNHASLILNTENIFLQQKSNTTYRALCLTYVTATNNGQSLGNTPYLLELEITNEDGNWKVNDLMMNVSLYDVTIPLDAAFS